LSESSFDLVLLIVLAWPARVKRAAAPRVERTARDRAGPGGPPRVMACRGHD